METNCSYTLVSNLRIECGFQLFGIHLHTGPLYFIFRTGLSAAISTLRLWGQKQWQDWLCFPASAYVQKTLGLGQHIHLHYSGAPKTCLDSLRAIWNISMKKTPNFKDNAAALSLRGRLKEASLIKKECFYCMWKLFVLWMRFLPVF